MAKRSRNIRENTFEPQIKGALDKLNAEIEKAIIFNGEHATQQSGITTVDSIRTTSEVLGPVLSRQECTLVRVALERVGLLIYSTFKPTSDEARRRSFRDKIQRSPFEYTIAGIQTETASLSFIDVAVGANSQIPAHQRIRLTHLDMSTHKTDDNIVQSTTLQTTQYQARSIRPTIELDISYTTLEEREYTTMIEKQLLDSSESTAAIASKPLRDQLSSDDPLVRAYANAVRDGRQNFSQANDLGMLQPSPMDINEIRAHISQLFNSED